MSGHSDGGGGSSEVGGRSTKKIHVPGSEAATVRVPGFWNSFPRILADKSSGLGSFFKSMCSMRPPARDEGRTPLPVVWPIPIPFPGLFQDDASGTRAWRRKRLCLQIVVMDWLWLGKPSIAPRAISLGQALTSRQWKVIKLLTHLGEDANSPITVASFDMGRAAAKAESSAGEIDALHRALAFLSEGGSYLGKARNTCTGVPPSDLSGAAFGAVVGEVDVGSFVAARPIQSDRLSFPGRPSFDPRPLFGGRTLEVYDDPVKFAKKLEDCEPPPKVKILASHTEKLKVLKKLAEGHRVIPLRADEIDEKYAAGLFSVLKDQCRDRMILDARPGNSREEALTTWTRTLASSTAVSLCEIPDDHTLLMSGLDLRDYFYQFIVSRKRAARNCLVGTFSTSDMQDIFSQTGVDFQGCTHIGLNTLAMGDLCACEFAQGAHLLLLIRAGVIKLDELIQHRLPYPRGLFGIGVVIDDLVALEKVLTKNIGDESFLSASTAMGRMTMAQDAYKTAGLSANEKKSFFNQSEASFWGCEVDGKKGTMRPNSSRMWPLILITLRVASLGLCTCSLLESLAGSWISIFLVRRRLMSCMNLIFCAISACENSGSVVRLSSKLVDELFCYCLLASVTFVNLRAKVASSIKASDSSDWGMAAVEADLPDWLAREGIRHSLFKSVWAQLLPPAKAWLRVKGQLHVDDELPFDNCLDVHPLWELLARAPVYRELWRKKHDRQHHINLTELRAHLREECRLSANSFSVRQLYGLDSQVSLGALVKGRCSSGLLNSELQRSIPTVVGADLYGFYLFFPSSSNRADAPTRACDPPPPDLSYPVDWKVEDGGDLAAFDAWMAKMSPLERKEEELAVARFTALDGCDVRSGRQKKAAVDRRKQSLLKVRNNVAAVDADTLPEGQELCVEAMELLSSFPEAQFVYSGDKLRLERRGALDLFSGKAGVARAMAKSGCPWILTFDWVRSPQENLLDAGLREKLLKLITLRAFLVVGSAIICSSFSKAVTPAVRSPRYPRGLPNIRSTMKRKVLDGNSHADFAAEVISLVESLNVFFWMENPDSSYLWRLRRFRRFADPSSDWLFRLDFCVFKTAWRKRTRIATNVPGLRGLRMMCRGGHEHLHLRGMSPIHKLPWTAVAEPYPAGLCSVMGRAINIAAGWSSGRLDVGLCAKCLSGRIGEAQNPGPRRKKAPRPGSLVDMPLQTFQTLALGSREWDSFLLWCGRFLKSSDPLELFLELPLFLMHAIRHYGDLQFQKGGSLSYYRHLILESIRRVPSSKQYASIAWDFASRWHKAEPTVHRVPIPLPLLKGLVSLSWLLGWKRWAGVTALAFFGLGRLGEVIRCQRRHLLLPRDSLNLESHDVFLVLNTSKTSFRNSAKEFSTSR